MQAHVNKLRGELGGLQRVHSWGHLKLTSPGCLLTAQVGLSALSLLHSLVAAHSASLRRAKAGRSAAKQPSVSPGGAGQQDREDGDGQEKSGEDSAGPGERGKVGKQEPPQTPPPPSAAAAAGAEKPATAESEDVQTTAKQDGGIAEEDTALRHGEGEEPEEILVPMPRVIRILASPRCLPHIAQVRRGLAQ